MIWVFLPQKGMLLWEHVAMHSGHLPSGTALCALGGFTVLGEPGTASSLHSQRQGWEGWWSSAWNSDPSPTVALGGGCWVLLLLLPLPLLVFTFLIWCVCLAPP